MDVCVLVDKVIEEFPDLKRQEALVYEISKKIILVYGVERYGTEEKNC